MAAQFAAEKADPRVRAGFMLIPEMGASMLMYVITRSPANTPV